MSRRAIAILLLCAVGLTLGLLPWTVTSNRVKAAIARQIRQEYGVDLAVEGRATVALLPVPRLKLETVRLSGGDGTFDAKAGALRAELRLAPLLTARLRLSELRISDATVLVRLDTPEAEAWITDAIRRRISVGGAGSSRVERLVVTGSVLALSDAAGSRTELRKLDAVLRWPDPSADLDLSATAEWRGDALSLSLTGLNPATLAAGRPDAVEGSVRSRLGRISGTGHLSWRDVPVFSGTVRAETPSLGALARWTGVGLDLRDLDRPLEVTGEATVGPDGIEWPRATLGLGGDRLDGSLAYRFDRRRPQLRATLAGEELDLGWVLPLADPARAEPPNADYDVRLSASSVRMGPLRFRDAAAGVLVSDQRIEVSLARATLANGSIRGRVTASLDGEGRDIRGQVALGSVDLERLLGDLGAPRGIVGTLTGQATFEVAGDRQPDLVRQLKGRATFTVRDGEIPGVSLGEMPRRGEGRSASDWEGGRTRFGSASLALEVGNGLVEIAEGSLETAATQTSLKGRVSLGDETIDLRATTRGVGGASQSSPPVTFSMRGPLARPRLVAEAARPDASRPDATGAVAKPSP